MRGAGSLNLFFFFCRIQDTGLMVRKWFPKGAWHADGVLVWIRAAENAGKREVKVEVQVETRSAQAESLFGILHVFWERPGAHCITRVSCDETSCEVLKLEFIAGTSTLDGTPAHDWVEGLSRRRGLSMHLGCVTPCEDDKPGTLRPQRKRYGKGGSLILS